MTKDHANAIMFAYRYDNLTISESLFKQMIGDIAIMRNPWPIFSIAALSEAACLIYDHFFSYETMWIAVVVFLGSFIPVVGAIITGALAVIIALVFNGWVAALLMLGVVLVVQFLESQILQPFLIGRAVSVHPLAIVLAVAVGALIAGIPGALFSVPIVAVINVMTASLMGDYEKPVTSKLKKKT